MEDGGRLSSPGTTSPVLDGTSQDGPPGRVGFLKGAAPLAPCSDAKIWSEFRRESNDLIPLAPFSAGGEGGYVS